MSADTGALKSPCRPALKPTLHFIGVTTASSSIMKVFPAWANYLGLADAQISGIDFPLHANPMAYREAVQFIHDDPQSMGALVTTHKIDLYNACRDLFDRIDPYAQLMGETSCLSKRAGKLICHAKDPITSGLAIDGFLGADYFKNTGAELFAIGAGGSTIALSWYLMRLSRGDDVPARIVVSDRSQDRLDEIQRIHAQIESVVPMEYLLAVDATSNDVTLAGLATGSLIINATGLGKDAPGSPLSGSARFPKCAVVWDLNYRGALLFLDQARAQAQSRQLKIVDGWIYFIHGWTQVIAEVFDICIDPDPENIAELTRIALAATASP